VPSNRWQRAKEVFAAALERPAADRVEFVRQSCGEDGDLRREVESLLAAGQEVGGFLSEPARLRDGEPVSRASTDAGRPPAVGPPLPAGTRLGPYELVSFVGAGGMGQVYKARDTRLDRTVAIKVLPAETADPRLRSRFEREARAISQLNHPRICALYDVGQHEEASFLVMEYLEGESLADRLKTGPLPLSEALRYAAHIAEALDEAHRHGIIHRDLKPANVVITEKGAKLLDFGIAKLRAAAPAEEDATRPRTLTAHGLIVGTLPYMAPEQLAGQAVDERTDVFALGLVLYEMVSGRKAFEAASAPQLIAAILKEDPPPLAKADPRVPPALAALVERCLAKDPGARWPSARDLLDALDQARQGLPVTTSQRPARRPASVGRWAAAVLALSVAGALAWAAARARLGAPAAVESLAVLPFADGTGAADGDYLGDGLAESLINTLAAVPQVRVAARTSAFRFKGRDEPPQEICRALGVARVLTGRVTRKGADIVVQVDLVEGRDGSQLWGKRYARPFSDLIVLQEEIARDVGARLGVPIGKGAERRLASRLTADPEAYRLFLLGRFHANQRTPEGMARALEFYKQAAARDPGFALAYAGQAEVLLIIMESAGTPAREGYPVAKAAASRALELAPDRAEAHAPLGNLAAAFEGDWARGEREFQRALELDPTYDQARIWYAYGLAAFGRGDDAIAQIREAEARDPGSFVTTLDGCVVLYFARRFDDGLAQCQKVLDMRPNDTLGRWLRVMMFTQQGRLPQAETELRAGLADAAGHPLEGTAVECAITYYSRAGRHPEARALLAETARNRPLRALNMAEFHAALGDTEEAFAWLQRAQDDRDPLLVFLNADVVWDPIRGDPRFREMTRRLGLPGA